ncbi:thioesterase [Actinomadura graeca]|uniref:Thioesterase n=1 Tax=Actinomadura graeca TaxID=2750812 RepID=A0ABX8QUZ0_9ACTN|nr:alpha/beta fold hydrolase [Actinomadura graeca]QXJ21804.1 thioesterase [Actinomadura graeca]
MPFVDAPSLRSLRTGRGARTRVVCFPHAGGAARFFAPWQRRVPHGVELLAVQYPGREDRLADPLVGDAVLLADGLVDEIGSLPIVPTVFFGHSMGAVVAYETARRLRPGNGRPALLAVSALPAPHIQRAGGIHLCDDEGLVAELAKVGGSAAALADQDLRDHILPIVRNDYRLLETYRHAHDHPCDLPIVVYSADQDTEATTEELAGWREVTSAECVFRRFSGDHFYLLPHASEILADLLERAEALR